jgi:transcription initiation factor TFIIA large subunit
MNSVAQQRAAQALQQQYGPRAAAQINQLQQSSGQRQQSGLPNPQYADSEDRKPLPNFSPAVPQSRAPLQSAQHDGGNDSLDEWKAEISRRRSGTKRFAAKAERIFHEHMLQKQQEIEGGGLMVPLEERYIPSPRSKLRVEAIFGPPEGAEQQQGSSQPSSLPKAQRDAAGDDDDDDKDLDEDAINSDLDDPDDAGGDPEDETVEQVMLCTYDKVQRVKNKWKCTLKDGILRVSNKE